MKKLGALLLLMSSYSALGYTTKIFFNESARKGGDFRITAHVDVVGADTREIQPSDKPFDLTTFGANCVSRFEVKVVGGEFNGAYIDIPIPVSHRCMNRTIRFAKAGELVQRDSRYLLFTSSDGKLAAELRPM